MVCIGNDWDIVLKNVFLSDNYQNIHNFLKTEYSNYTVYPPMYDIFNAFKKTPYNMVKAVILGQDPYHEQGEANGLCFSVNQGIKMPPSLANIFKELKNDLGIDNGNKTDLNSWANEGVLLLNTSLTVRKGIANSHKNCGWSKFTDDVISLLSNREKPIVFILWGNNARSKKSLIDLSKHYVVESAHPSPLSCYNGFFGSKPFSKTNQILNKLGYIPINWKL